jgi:hypothetical protein
MKCFPKCAFVFWLTIKVRLVTRDRMAGYVRTEVEVIKSVVQDVRGRVTATKKFISE